jgi:DNA gyrase, B subunit
MMKFIRELFRSCVLDDIKDSAGGSAKQGRDVATQAILPIRGKIINVEKEDLQKVLKNEEVKSLINAIGAGFLDTFDVNKMRYGKIIICTDADIDAVGDQILYKN